MEERILFLDLDGTVLNDEREISAGNREAIQTVRSRGCRVVVASGRTLHSALIQARRLGLAGPGHYVIAYNGAVIYDCGRGTEIFRRTLEMEDLFALYDEAASRKIHIQTYRGAEVVVEPRCDGEEIRAYCQKTELEFRVIGSVRQLTEPPVKALCIVPDGRHEDLAAMQRWTEGHLAGRVECFFSSQTYLEMVPSGIDKGQAVRSLCGLLRIPVANAVAVGDEANDIPMLRTAGVGVAVQNAVPAAKAAADYVTERDNNHDAAAEAVQRFLL